MARKTTEVPDPDLTTALSTDLTELIERGSPYAQTLGPELVSREPGRVVMRLDAPASLHNHVGGPHAATIFGLGETTAGAVMLSDFEAEVRAGAIPLVKSVEITYLAVTYGVVTATAVLTGDPDGVRASLALRGVAVFPVEVAFTTDDGSETARMTAQMALKRY